MWLNEVLKKGGLAYFWVMGNNPTGMFQLASHFQTQAGVKSSEQELDILNSQSMHLRSRGKEAFSYRHISDAEMQIEVAEIVSNPAGARRGIKIILWNERGGHAIAVARNFVGTYLFDPNFGSYRLAPSDGPGLIDSYYSFLVSRCNYPSKRIAAREHLLIIPD